METISKLRFWCYKILPLVYDDSLSYYEAICKTTQKLNEIIGNVNELPDYINKEIAEQIGNNGDLFERLFAKIIKAVASCIDDAESTSEEKFGGEIFWHNGELVECVKHMEVGTNYVTGTNIEVINIIDLLNDIKSYISTKTEKYNKRADREIQQGEYLFWKDKFLKANQTITNDTVLTDDMFDEVCVGDELKLETDTRVSEVTRLDKKIDDNVENLQTQITSNDSDITGLQQKDIELKHNIDTNNTNINARVSNIVSQSGNDNTEITDARTSSNKFKVNVFKTLHDCINAQIQRSINAIATFGPTNITDYIASGDLLDARPNTVYGFYGFTNTTLPNAPAGVFQGILLVYSPSTDLDTQNYKVYLLVDSHKNFYVGSVLTGKKIEWNKIANDVDVNTLNQLISSANIEIDDAKKTSAKFPYFKYNSLYKSINAQIQRSINAIATFGPNNITDYIASGDLLDARPNTVYGFYGFTNTTLPNAPAGVFQGILLVYSPSTDLDTQNYKVYLLVDSHKNFYVGSVLTGKKIEWNKIANDTDVTDIDNKITKIENKTNNYLSTSAKNKSYLMLKSVGCIGDSYTAGYVYNPDDGKGHDYKEYSWPSVMESVTGNKYYNYGISGANAKTWQTNGFNLINNRKCQAYLIGIGINDSTDGTNSLALGVESDIGTDNDTFYGWYSKLIRRVHALNEQAYIICMTMGTDITDKVDNYNNAIKIIVNKLAADNKCYLLDLYKYKDYYVNGLGFDFYEFHYTPRGYAIMQDITASALSELINSNNDFREIYKIPYDK